MSGWAAERAISRLPTPGDARADLEEAVASFAPARVARLLPWPVGDR
ncbi:MAG: hypothetical protein ACXVJ7_09650 [Acidimicrobiia bacterium]